MLQRLFCFIGLLAIGCHQNYEEGAHPQPNPPPEAQMPASHPPVETAQRTTTDGEAILSGTIRIDESLQNRVPSSATLYIMARPAPVGPPLAIKRIPIPTFPHAYSFSQADAGMMPGQEVDLNGLDALYVSVKIDQDGMVGPPQPGDMEGVYSSNPVAPGNHNVDIIINKAH